MLAGYSIPRCGSPSLTGEGLRVGEPNKTTTQPVGLESYHIQGKLQTLLGKNDKNYFQILRIFKVYNANLTFLAVSKSKPCEGETWIIAVK